MYAVPVLLAHHVRSHSWTSSNLSMKANGIQHRGRSFCLKGLEGTTVGALYRAGS